MPGSDDRQTALYASPLEHHRTYIDLTNTPSPPAPPLSTQRQHSPPHALASIERGAFKGLQPSPDTRGREYVFSSHRQDGEGERLLDRREGSPIPRILSSRPSDAAPGQDHVLDVSAPRQRGPPSPRLMKGRVGGGTGFAHSYDSQDVRTLSGRGDIGDQQRSNSVEGAPFKRWGPFTSPLAISRLPKRYMPTNLSNRDLDAVQRKPLLFGAREGQQGLPIQATRRVSHPQQQGQLDATDRHSDITVKNRPDMTPFGTSLKRKVPEDAREERDDSARSDPFLSHRHYSSIAPPSAHLYGDVDRSRRDVLLGSFVGAKRHGDAANTLASVGRRLFSAQDPDEVEEDHNMGAEQSIMAGPFQASEGSNSIVPQRKSCDRCFKMKTKCSRAAPGMTGEGPCEGCIRRGFGEDCVTSRPDFPYPRISLSKRSRRESSLPALLEANGQESSAFVPSSLLQRSDAWRPSLADQSGRQQRAEREEGQPAQKSVFTSPPAQAGKEHRSGLDPASTGLTVNTRAVMLPPSSQAVEAVAAPHVSQLCKLQTTELRDLSIFIAHEITQRAQPSQVKTPTVPSVPFPRQAADQSNTVCSSSRGTNGSGLVSQAMQNAPMQLLPKAAGLPALDYFALLFHPLLSLPVLSGEVLRERYEAYGKPGRNNILEIAMAIALQMQGVLLSSPDKAQANAVEGRILKAFLQSGKQQQQQQQQTSHHHHHHNHHHQQEHPQQSSHAQDKKASGSNGDARLSFESVKGWIEPARHRSRAKDIVKHVLLRRCLKNGLDYDDVLENVLLAYFFLLRGDVASYYVHVGTAHRQASVLAIQCAGSALWSVQDIDALRSAVDSMGRLQPLHLFAHDTPTSPPSLSQVDIPSTFCVAQQKRLAEIADACRMAADGRKGAVNEEAVDQLCADILKSLPAYAARYEGSEAVGLDDFETELVRADGMTPCLRLNLMVTLCFFRLMARQSSLIRAVDASTEEQQGTPAMDPAAAAKEEVAQRVAKIRQIASSMISSTLLALVLSPPLLCLLQLYAAELTAGAWSFAISHLLLPPTSAEDRSNLVRMEDMLNQVIDLLELCQEKEAWPCVDSLRLAKEVVSSIKEGDKGVDEWRAAVQTLSKDNREQLVRLLRGDPWAAEGLSRARQGVSALTLAS